MVLGWLWNGPKVILEWSWGVSGVALGFWSGSGVTLEWFWGGSGMVLR